MREIKFRGKCIETNQWVYGYYDCVRTPFINWMEEYGMGGMLCSAQVDPKTVGQYTGLKDKNGTEIYEGDILKMHQFLFDGNEYEKETIGVIKWGEYGWLLSQIDGKEVNEYMGHKNGEGETYLIHFYGLHEESFEVIGNIHDNPELVEEELK